MRATIVIPSYWGRPSGAMMNMDDAVYDHPTPMDQPGTLERALESIDILSNRDFNVVVLAASTSPDIAPAVEEKVRAMVEPFRQSFPVVCLSHYFEEGLKDRVTGQGDPGDMAELVSLTGYSNIRNMCLIAAELAGSEVAVLFDDDEVYQDPGYLDRVFENIGGEHQGKFVGALAGYYLRPEGGYLLPPPKDWWMVEWPMVDTMNQAFGIIGREPRLKVTPFVFGGNMVVHRDVWRKIPFDPNVRRGEDIDFLVNCKFFDIDFLLDNLLSILHLPPPKGQLPPWVHLRENVYRFIYAREKLRHQRPVDGLRLVEVEELDPYPGSCMKGDLEELIFRTSVLIGLHSLERDDQVGFREAMETIHLARYDAPPKFDTFQWYLDYQARWERFMLFLSEDKTLSNELLADLQPGG